MGNFKFLKLTPHNYATWSIKMWCHLMHNGVSQFVDGTLSKPTSDNVLASDISTWEAMDRKALGDIFLGVEFYDLLWQMGNIRIVFDWNH